MSKAKTEAIPTVSITKVKEPRTIKVKTVVIAIIVTVVIATAFIGGWIARSHDMSRVQAEASVLVSQLKVSE